MMPSWRVPNTPVKEDPPPFVLEGIPEGVFEATLVSWRLFNSHNKRVCVVLGFDFLHEGKSYRVFSGICPSVSESISRWYRHLGLPEDPETFDSHMGRRFSIKVKERIIPGGVTMQVTIMEPLP